MKYQMFKNLLLEMLNFTMAVLLTPFFLLALFLLCLAGTVVYFLDETKFWLLYPEVAEEVADIIDGWLQDIRLK